MRSKTITILIRTLFIMTLLCSCTANKPVSEDKKPDTATYATSDDIKNTDEKEENASEEGRTGQNSSTDSTEQAISEALKSDMSADMPQMQLEALPVFSHTSGCYSEQFTLSITAPEGLTIIYTTDGSDPRSSESAVECAVSPSNAEITVTDRKDDKCLIATLDPNLFDAANCKLNSSKKAFVSQAKKPADSAVDKCTVIRAVCRDKSGNCSKVVTHTYFVGSMSDHIYGIEQSSKASGADLAVVSIVTDSSNLFDPVTGIYVKGKIFDDEIAKQIAKYGKIKEGDARNIDANYKQRGRDWEREVHVDLFEANVTGAECVISQDCGIRIQGNYSRSDLIKGFRLYARSEYGAKNFKYPVFGDSLTDDTGKVMDKFKSLTLRNGGNCAFTTKYSDTFWQGLVTELDCETQASRPAVVYINGEYWGLYVLQEDYSDDYFEDTHGVSKENVVVYKGDAEALVLGYKLDEGKLPEGVNDERYYFRDLLSFFDTHRSLAKKEDYDEFVKLVDPESVRDYFAVECWINNKWDWPGKNWSMWRVVGADGDDTGNPYNDGRWRFCFYDMEFGGVSGSGDAYVNTIKEDNYKPKGLLDMNTDNPAVLCFAYLMTNSSFKADFIGKLVSLSKNEFETGAATAALDKINDTYSPLYEQFFARFPGSGSKENSVWGGYASYRCIKDFLEQRPGYIGKMISWIP